MRVFEIVACRRDTKTDTVTGSHVNICINNLDEYYNAHFHAQLAIQSGLWATDYSET
jgi:hypothetical protein